MGEFGEAFSEPLEEKNMFNCEILALSVLRIVEPLVPVEKLVSPYRCNAKYGPCDTTSKKGLGDEGSNFIPKGLSRDTFPIQKLPFPWIGTWRIG